MQVMSQTCLVKKIELLIVSKSGKHCDLNISSFSSSVMLTVMFSCHRSFR